LQISYQLSPFFIHPSFFILCKGKTAIAEGIAQRMVAGDVPDTLKPPCKLIGLDMGALVAGSTMRGEFEERLKSVIDEVQKSDGEIVLFIDEVSLGVDFVMACLWFDVLILCIHTKQDTCYLFL
jgi:hypothetical protein